MSYTLDNVYFTVRDGFGDDVGSQKYLVYDDAEKMFKQYCENSGEYADGAMLGIVYKGEDRDYKCVLVQNDSSNGIHSYRSMYKNITARALAVPEIELCALRARQLEFPFDEATQNKIDALEKRLGVYERELSFLGDLYVGKWRVHIVPPGGRYGVNNRITNTDKDSLVEFWDVSQPKLDFPNGQFVTRYDVETLLSDRWGAGPEETMQHGLILDYDNRDFWSVTGPEMIQIFGWLKNRELLPGENYLEYHGEVDVPFDVVDHIPLPHLDSEVLASEVVLDQRLNGNAFVRDLSLEMAGVYDKGVGYTFSFSTQLNHAEVNQALEKSLDGMPHEFYCDWKAVPVPQRDLGRLISEAENQKSVPGSREDGRSARGEDGR